MSAPPARVAGYPVRVANVTYGALRLQLLLVKRLEEYVDAAELLRNPDAPEPPYWAHLWPGSRALARLVATAMECRGQRVVDIGCGLGLAGLAAAARGASVVMMDAVPAAVQFAAANAALNACGASVVQTDLRHPGLRGRFDMCLAADVTYDPALQCALADFLAAHLAPRGTAWCAESVRTFETGFRDACAARGLRVSEREVHEPDDGRSVPVRLTAIRWP